MSRTAATQNGQSAALPRLPVGGDAGLVSSKTSDTPRVIDFVSISHESTMQRRIARLRRTVWFTGYGHQMTGAADLSHWRGEKVWFVTLTYRGVDDWRPFHISACIKRVRQWLKRKTGLPLRYTWVAELQKRGAVHYHVAVWLPKGITMPKWDKQGWWPHGFTNVERARAAIGYLMKYVSKIGEIHQFPKGCRIHGNGGLNKQARDIKAWLNLPSWIKQVHGVGEIVRKRFGYMVRETGEILTSPWRVVRGEDGLRLFCVGSLPERWADGAYSQVRF